MKLTVLVPVFNEEGNIPGLFDELGSVLGALKKEYEIIVVNDGSSDDTRNVLEKYAKKDERIKVINLAMNAGKTVAMSAGLTYVTGDIIITIDGDLENDPHDIPEMLKKLDEGYGVVSGWRKERWPGKFLSRKLPSVTANWLISRVTGQYLHDYGCMLKIYRAKYLRDLQLYGEMQRFLPAFAAWKGAKVLEMPVNYRKRKHGVSKYGIFRTFQVLLDLVLIRFLRGHMTRPMYFFGGVGFVSFFLGVLAGLASIILKLMEIRNIVDTPLPIFSALLLIIGVQFIGIGILAEIMIRVYYEGQKKPTYTIEDMFNIKDEKPSLQ